MNSFNIIKTVRLTEKGTRQGEKYNQYTVVADRLATKPQIKQAVEALFGVKVKGVNTIILKGKTKAFKGTRGFRSDMKKAIIKLEDGQTIDIGAGV